MLVAMVLESHCHLHAAGKSSGTIPVAEDGDLSTCPCGHGSLGWDDLSPAAHVPMEGAQ